MSYLPAALSHHQSQGLDEEAIVDHGKASFTTHTHYGREELESKSRLVSTYSY